jgi:hypothetical protein
MDLIMSKTTLIESLVFGLVYYRFHYLALSFIVILVGFKYIKESIKLNLPLKKFDMEAASPHPSIKGNYIVKNTNIPSFEKINY